MFLKRVIKFLLIRNWNLDLTEFDTIANDQHICWSIELSDRTLCDLRDPDF